MVNTNMFKHPKYYKELRKRNKSDQVISKSSHDGESERAPGPGLKPQDNNASFEGISEAEYNKRHMKALKDVDPVLKQQASSDKLQASSVKLSNQPVQVSSDKHPNHNHKRQASSPK